MYRICIETLCSPLGRYTHKVYVQRGGKTIIEGRLATVDTADAIAHGMEDVLKYHSEADIEIMLVSEVKL